ncbi:MAG: hypothetical protein WBQ43_19990, partial [Terriglobales bacterium]
PACGAKLHEYPSYYPLRLTVGSESGKVNGKANTGHYPSNGAGESEAGLTVELRVRRGKDSNR